MGASTALMAFGITMAIATIFILWYILPRSKIIAGILTMALSIGMSAAQAQITGNEGIIQPAVAITFIIGLIIALDGWIARN